MVLRPTDSIADRIVSNERGMGSFRKITLTLITAAAVLYGGAVLARETADRFIPSYGAPALCDGYEYVHVPQLESDPVPTVPPVDHVFYNK